MPTLELKIERLERLVGKKLDIKDLEYDLQWIGLDLEEINEEDQKIKVEYNPNRPDYSSPEGIARTLQGYYEIKLGIPSFEITPGEIELNAGRPTTVLRVANTGDRPIQVGSHYHFFEVNPALEFERERAKGMRLDIPAGTAVRFEPGDEREVTIIPLAGTRHVYGFNSSVNGALDG